ncbi:MAG: type II secretion system protein GspG [Verrucomicrobiota bacterium JB022]|nr:type II secretion system protein GspG [Verrucomicrobiota bacterium JB022]
MCPQSNESTASIFTNASIQAPLTQYRIDTGSYPTTAQGLAALWEAPAEHADSWNGPYIDAPDDVIDLWSRPYQYRFPGERNEYGARKYDIWSLGPDSDDPADDIGNW